MATYYIGMDEAGYGPNLGPLVIGATIWRLEAQPTPAASNTKFEYGSLNSAGDLYEILAKAIAPKRTKGLIPIADSKKLYSPSGKLSNLEKGVLTACGLASQQPSKAPTDRSEFPKTRQLLFDNLRADPGQRAREILWQDNYTCDLPVDTSEKEIVTLKILFQETLKAEGVQLLMTRARLVYPAEFNELTERFGNKASALSNLSLGMLRAITREIPTNSSTLVEVVCDKHGGRNKYAQLLQNHFPTQKVITLIEAGEQSRYHWSGEEGRWNVRFQMRGESYLPAALASMN